MESSDPSKPIKPGVKRAFVQHLPQRLAAVRTEWQSLKRGVWDKDRFEKLYQRILDLGETAARLGLPQVSESAFSLEVYLSTFGDSESRPGLERISETDSLIRALEAAVQSTVESDSLEEARDTGHSPTLYCLLGSTDLVPGLESTLRARHWRVRAFPEPGQIKAALAEHVPDAMVLDARFIRGLLPVFEVLKQIRTTRKQRVPMVFVAATNDLQRRLAAMRAGADAYFVAPLDAATLAGRLSRLVAPRDPSPYRVLVVEDDPSQAKFAATILRKSGMDTRVVTEALEVMDAIRGFEPDIVLMDVYMPEASGVELTRIIRQQEDLVTLPIVYLSGEQNPEKQQSALSVGADDFIAKPIRPKHLIATVNNRIARARQLRENLGPATAPEIETSTGLSTKQRFFERVDQVVREQSGDEEEGGLLHIHIEGPADAGSGSGRTPAEAVIETAGRRIASRLAEGDVATRLGDSSFAVLIGQPRLPEVRALADRLLQAITGEPYEVEGKKVRLSASAGLCPLYRGLSDGIGAAARAAKATRAASRAGGDRVEVYSESAASAGAKAEGLSQRLREGLSRGSARLLLRPVTSLRSGNAAETYEVSVSLGGDGEPDRDMDPPELRAVADRSNLGEQLDRWLLSQALAKLEEQETGTGPVRLYLRLSPSFLENEEARSWLRAELRSRHLGGEGLMVELPLPAVAADPKGKRVLVRRLADMGIDTVLSRFTGSEAAFRVLRFLGSGYIEITEAAARADQGQLAQLTAHAHEAGALVIVPATGDEGAAERNRSAGADLVRARRPGPAADTGAGARGG